MASLPLGLRNNNPGNIEFGKYARSKGSTRAGEGGRFAYFSTMREGIAALAALLLIYYRTHKIATIRGVVNRWAPGTENNVDAYISHICAVTECKADDKLNFEDGDTLFWLTVAICEHENGKAAVNAAISDEDFEAGIAAALGDST